MDVEPSAQDILVRLGGRLGVLQPVLVPRHVEPAALRQLRLEGIQQRENTSFRTTRLHFRMARSGRPKLTRLSQLCDRHHGPDEVEADHMAQATGQCVQRVVEDSHPGWVVPHEEHVDDAPVESTLDGDVNRAGHVRPLLVVPVRDGLEQEVLDAEGSERGAVSREELEHGVVQRHDPRVERDAGEGEPGANPEVPVKEGPGVSPVLQIHLHPGPDLLEVSGDRPPQPRPQRQGLVRQRNAGEVRDGVGGVTTRAEHLGDAGLVHRGVPDVAIRHPHVDRDPGEEHDQDDSDGNDDHYALHHHAEPATEAGLCPTNTLQSPPKENARHSGAQAPVEGAGPHHEVDEPAGEDVAEHDGGQDEPRLPSHGRVVDGSSLHGQHVDELHHPVVRAPRKRLRLHEGEEVDEGDRHALQEGDGAPRLADDERVITPAGEVTGERPNSRGHEGRDEMIHVDGVGVGVRKVEAVDHVLGEERQDEDPDKIEEGHETPEVSEVH